MRFGFDAANYAPTQAFLQRAVTFTEDDTDRVELFPSDFVLSDIDSPEMANATVTLSGDLDASLFENITVDEAVLLGTVIKMRTKVSTVGEDRTVTFVFFGAASSAQYRKVYSEYLIEFSLT